MKSVYTLFYSLWFACSAYAQQLVQTDSIGNVSIRGLSVVSDSIVWLSGSRGTVAMSTNGGRSWNVMQIPGYERRDFRDIEAFDANTAIIMAVDTPAVILKTKNGGKDWKRVYENKTPGMFLDAMEFWNEMSGVVVGDPVEGKIFIARTFDGGESWRGLPEAYYPTAEKGEAMFAASGSNITKINQQEAVFVTGGAHARLFLRDQKIKLPLLQGQTTTGANAVAVWKEKNMIIVGGDFARDTLRSGNCVITRDRGKTFIIPPTPPFGYRSSVTYISATKLITCGSSGVDVSEDGGMHWRNISATGYHVVKKAKKGNAVFLAGPRGRVTKLEWKK